MKERFDQVNGINLHINYEGDAQAKIIIFLHGFPEFGYAWHQQITFFASQGYYALAPDQRGYNLSDKPKGVKAYRLDALVTDVAEWIKQLTPHKVILVAHDWGGGVAWALAAQHPELLQKLVILNMPHLAVMKKHLRTNIKQIFKSWYAAFFQIPLLPELLCRLWNFRFLTQALVRSANPDTFTAQELENYRKAWRQPYALTAMLNWYRAFRYDIGKKHPEVSVPTLIIWGKKDSALSAEMAEDSLATCKQGKLFMIEDATHWLHHEKPDEINQMILRFIRE
ncbi:alpha/beta hydrolase [Mucilaginibacter sp. CSA2-8R]|uniref:alpha/beta fold hydrolase n=1 Tax=Mucilaginibacter sp. CSA2-8R TaxID=3141542 RepID=UPI00315D35F7